jgi:hypothetical protein
MSIFEVQLNTDPNFVDPGKDIIVMDIEVLSTQTGLDSQLTSVVPAKDRPHLTMNDKMFAARQALGHHIRHGRDFDNPAPPISEDLLEN